MVMEGKLEWGRCLGGVGWGKGKMTEFREGLVGGRC